MPISDLYGRHNGEMGEAYYGKIYGAFFNRLVLAMIAFLP